MSQTPYRPVKLSVNVDHVATLRQARGTEYPDPLEAALLAEKAGADGITVHLRGDRRHIQDEDMRRIGPEIRGKLNLEMAATEEMIALALETRPQQVTLVPERPGEVTTEGGLDLLRAGNDIGAASERLLAAGIAVSLFLDPDQRQIEALTFLGERGVTGFEINTDAYTKAKGSAVQGELEKILAASAQGAAAGFEVYAGHGLTTANVGPVAAVPEIEELNIGHWLISRSVLLGIDAAVAEMLAAIRAAGPND